MRRSAIRCSRNRGHPFVAKIVEEAPNVGVQHPAYLTSQDAQPQCIQRIMAASAGSKPVAEAQEILLIDGFEHGLDGLLDDFVFQGSNAQGTLTPVGFGNPCPFGGLGSVGAPMDASVEVRQAFLQAVSIFLPRDAIDAGGRRALQLEIAGPQEIDSHVVQQRGKPNLLVPLRGFSYALQSATTLARRCVRHVPGWQVVSLGRPPSLHRLRRREVGFVRLLLGYYGAVRLPEGVHARRAAKGLLGPFRPAVRRVGVRRRGSLRGLPVSVQRVSTHAQGLRLRGVPRRLACCAIPDVASPLTIQGRHARGGDFGARWLACVCPCQRFTHIVTNVGV